MATGQVEETYMRRCFELATHGLGRTRPNPMVGCVIVKDGEIISEGFHQVCGQNHAERNAILNCSQPDALQGSTLYCNLEPCSHYGLTPPCADLIVEHRIGKVVCCNDDPNPKVNGRGFQILQEAGIEVKRHVLEDEGRWLNRRFFTFQEKHRPYIILKWAESADGFMAPDYQPYWITNSVMRQLSHKWRSEEAAIMVGSTTFEKDHPTLNTRLWAGQDPQPIVLDRSTKLKDVPQHWIHYSHQDLQDVMNDMYERKLQSVIVEGGRQVLDSFIEAGLYDEIRILRGTPTYHSGLKAPQVPSCRKSKTETYLDNTVTYYYV